MDDITTDGRELQEENSNKGIGTYRERYYLPSQEKNYKLIYK